MLLNLHIFQKQFFRKTEKTKEKTSINEIVLCKLKNSKYCIDKGIAMW